MTYEDEYDFMSEEWSTETDQDAKQKRDRRARELRSQGWTVQIETRKYNKGTKYLLDAERRKDSEYE